MFDTEYQTNGADSALAELVCPWELPPGELGQAIGKISLDIFVSL